MSEKSAQTKKKLAQNADKIAIAVLAVIFAGLLYVWWQEQSNTLGQDAPTGQDANLQDQLADSAALEMLQNMSATPTLASAPEIQRVAQLNMFDFSTLDQESQVEAQAQQGLAQAKTLIEQGQPEQARPLLEQAMKVMSYNPEVHQLMDSITTETDQMPATDPTAIADPNAML